MGCQQSTVGSNGALPGETQLHGVPFPQEFFEKYEVSGEVLGKGGYSEVVVASERMSRGKVAAKIILKPTVTRLMECKKEIAILEQLDHPNIIHFKGSFLTDKMNIIVEEIFQGKELFYRIIELYEPEDGSDPLGFTEKEAHHIIRQVVEAVDYCHSRRILHRDIKAENVLVDQDSNVKLIDMGLAERLEPGIDQFTDYPCGTPGYIAPEILLHPSDNTKVAFTTKADIWSLGVMAFEICSGYPPFYAEEASELMRLSKAGEYEYLEDAWGCISKECKGMIDRMLVVGIEQRASAAEILESGWLAIDSTNVSTSPLDTLDGTKKMLARKRWAKGIRAILAVNRMRNTIKNIMKAKNAISKFEEAIDGSNSQSSPGSEENDAVDSAGVSVSLSSE